MNSTKGLTPGLSMNVVIDYTTNSGIKQWTTATCKLEDELYNREDNMLHSFLYTVAIRAKVSEWLSICNINGKNLLKEYGTISMDEYQDNVKTCFELDTMGR